MVCVSAYICLYVYTVKVSQDIIGMQLWDVHVHAFMVIIALPLGN